MDGLASPSVTRHPRGHSSLPRMLGTLGQQSLLWAQILGDEDTAPSPWLEAGLFARLCKNDCSELPVGP